jgi:hypothetical protein
MALTEWPTKIDVLEVQLAADRQDVVRIALKGAISDLVEGGLIRLAVANVVEENDPVAVLEGRGDVAPHVLVAAIAVGEEHGLLTLAGNLNIVSLKNERHGA